MKATLAMLILLVAGDSRSMIAQAAGNAAGPFAGVSAVLSSPRCANCHIPGEAPLQGDDRHPHTMRVVRSEDGRGSAAMRCTNCHQEVSSPVRHAPPGALDWRLPPRSQPMAWGGLDAADQCRALKDRAANGDRDPAALLEHVTHDRLVLASWTPGPGRASPPLTHDEFVRVFKEWIDGGARCPE